MEHIGEGAGAFIEYLHKLRQLQQEKLKAGELQTVQHHSQKQTSRICSKCNDDYVYLVKDENGIDVARQCECVEARKAERLFKSSAITEEFRKLRFGNFDVEGKPPEVAEAKTMALKYFKEFDDIRKNRKNSIAMLGQPGSGKTHLLIALCLNLIAKGVSVHYFQWVDGMNDLQSDFNLLNQKIERLQRVEVLYIDDLFKGRDKPTPWQMSQAFAIINYRYLNHLPILVSAERDFEVLMNPEYGDEALGSRLYEMCRDYTMVLDGKHLNHRLR